MKTCRSIGSSIFDVPTHILMEILAKLPMTTICNCRCACSYFRKLISDPDFVQLHLSSSTTTSLILAPRATSASTVFLVESLDSHLTLHIAGKEDDIPIPRDTLLKLTPKFDLELEVLSCCNGLICFHCPRTYDPYVISNPVINEFVIVPQTEKGFFDHRGSGFGYHPGTNQYKVLRFLYPRLGLDLQGLTDFRTEINTVGTSVWRRVGDAPQYLHWLSSGCFMKGALHWIVHNSENCYKSLCRFDFGNEQFQPFPGPSQFDAVPGLKCNVNVMNMGLLRDCLSIFHHATNYKLDIWVMKNYGVGDSWTKEYAIELPWPVNFYGYLYRPVMVLDSGEILMMYGLLVMITCNTTDRSFRRVRINGIPAVVRPTAYIPSFVSIKNAAEGGDS